jgi:predicted DsbA family dithiol-disulfide isomerase
MSEKPTITVWSDYVCPWCYVGLTEVEKLRDAWDFDIEWRPFLLRPETPDEGLELPPYIRQKMADPNNPLAARAKALGITIHQRDLIPSSRRAHEATEYARSKGKIDSFHHAVLERYWSQGEDLHDWAVLRGAAVEAGLDADEMQRQVDAGQWRQPMIAGVESGTAIGVNAVPTFIVGNRFVIQGAQSGGVFAQAFERLGATARRPSLAEQ